MIASPAAIPVTVVGGFLGAGKTTFVNHLLRTGTVRTAVLVNDFGEINIDAKSILNHDGSTMTLTNGCICCSIGGGFIETMSRVLDADVPFERIVIEASGVGDPWRIAEIALLEPGLRLDVVIVVADVGRIVELLTDPRVGETVCAQFEHCDVVLLNKCDLADAARLRVAREALLALKADLRIIETSKDSLPSIASLDGIAMHSRFHASSPVTERDHGAKFRRWAYRRDSVFDRQLFGDAIRALPPQLLRLKGFCRFSGDSETTMFQMVETTWSLSPRAPDQESPSSIVLIGVGTSDLPPESILDAILDGALAPRESLS